MNLLVC